MARKRPTASDVARPVLIGLDGGKAAPATSGLTRSEAHALLRSAPVTHAQLKRHLEGQPDSPKQAG